MTTPEQYQRAKALFEQACDLPAEQRSEFVSHFCDDSEVRAQVEQLLRADAADSTLLRTPPPDAATTPTSVRMPETIGPYRILSRLGIGGMGTVYEAEQQHPRRVVALKVITPGLEAQGIMKRFQREADLLGRLQHEGIAQVYDAGSFDTDAGPRPYFAMELVRGLPITEYAEKHALPTRERLALLKQVCDAVQHAHERGVIHRDLKPSNILVTDAGKPKVLDFGIARPAEPHASDITVHTRTGQLVGTVTYMSPEQASGRDEVDQRADVYSLGVIAYELLTGKLPFDLKGQMLHEAVRTIQEREAPSLSTVSRGRSTDLDTIVRKALAKEKDRRYQSARDLGEDIERFLQAKPISARPPSTLYQLKKFSQRNRALVSAAAVVFLALSAGLIATSIGLRQAVAARSEAEAQREEAIAARQLAEDEQKQTEASLKLLTDALYNVNLNEYGSADYTVSQLLDDITSAIDTNADLLPVTKANLRMILGDTLVGLSRWDEARVQFQKAFETRRALFGLENEQTIGARTDYAAIMIDLGEDEPARAMLVDNLEIAQRILDPTNTEVDKCRTYLANVTFRLGDYAGAAALFEQQIVDRERLGLDLDAEVYTTMTSLALTYQLLGRLEDAVAMNEEAVAGYTQTLGPEHLFTLTARANLALTLQKLKRYEEAEREMKEVLAIRERTLPADHSDIGVSKANLSRLLIELGRLDEAEPLAASAMEVLTNALGADHRYTERARAYLIQVYEQTGRLDQAERLRELVPAADTNE
ncbi:MAG: serine/threonine protein kinase [Phycisphaerales bacterium]|nr:serine/threonine protein kinase [Phycisphaerales bacterium]